MKKETKRSYQKLIKKINQSGVISEKEINRIKNALSRDFEDINAILSECNFHGFYEIEKSQKLKGALYLVKKHLKANGTQRKTSNIDADFIDLIQAIKDGEQYDFTFEGFKVLSNDWWRVYMPIYKLIVGDKMYFYFHFNGEDYDADTTYIDNWRVSCYDYEAC